MTDKEWREEMRTVTALYGHKPNEAIASLKEILARLKPSDNATTSDWHRLQALSLLATLLGERGHHRAAAKHFELLAKEHQSLLAFHGHGAASALAAGALERFESGDGVGGARLTREALRYFGDFPEPSVILEQVLSHFRVYEQARAKERRKKA